MVQTFQLYIFFPFFFKGLIIIGSPSFVVGNEVMPIPSGVRGEVFCRLIQNNLFVWLLTKVSVSLVMTMAIERWYAIALPHKYRTIFKPANVSKCICLILVSNIAAILPQSFKIHLVMKGSGMTCIYNSLGNSKTASQVYVITYCVMTVFIPFAVIIATYIHLRCGVTGQQQRPQTRGQIQRRQVEMVLLRMTSAVALCLMICFIPNQITYILHSFDVGHLVIIRVAAVLTMLNSVINPWLYCLTNPSYREEFKSLFLHCKNSNIGQVASNRAENTNGNHEMTNTLPSSPLLRQCNWSQ